MHKINIWVQKILPLVYDNSLSYYEVLGKVVAKINEMIKYLTDSITEIADIATNALNTANSAEDVALGIDAKAQQALDTANGFDTRVSKNEDDIANLENSKQDKLTFDAMPTQNSQNPVRSGGVYTALAGKQNTLSFDDYPTQGSSNPVKSGGVYSELANKQNNLIFDSQPVENSVNPVTSGGLYTQFNLKQDKLTFDNTPTQGSNNPVTSNGIYDAITSFFPLFTKSGNPVVIDDAANAPIDTLELDIEATQDLNGYDYPWPYGAGASGDPDSNYCEIVGKTEAVIENTGDNDSWEVTVEYNRSVYGGTIDVISGKLTLTSVCHELDGTEGFTKPAANNRVTKGFSTLGWETPNSESFTLSYSSHFKYNDYSGGVGDNWGNFRVSSTTLTFGINNSDIASGSDFDDYLAAQYANETPVQVCYVLATPIVVQLTPYQMRTFYGNNEISADNNMIVKYRADYTFLINSGS